MTVAASNGSVEPMKEDILDQIVDDYLQFKGYFTTHNVRFKRDAAHPDYVGELGAEIPISETEIELTLLTRDPAHCDEVIATMRGWGCPRDQTRPLNRPRLSA